MSKRFTYFGIPGTLLLITLSILGVEACLFAADAGYIGSPTWRAWAYQHGAFWAVLLKGAEPVFPGQPATMFATYAFLHGGLLHVVVNSIALLSFGTAIIQRIGQKRFLIAYFVTAVGGGACFGLFSSNPAPMVGASGALFGLLGIWVCWDYLDRRYYGDPLWVTARAIVFLIVYNLVFFVLLSGNLAWETHLGGFVTGWLLAVHWGRSILDQSRRRRNDTGATRRP